jgi:hypothetical protein
MEVLNNKCACGCGFPIPFFDKRKRPVRFRYGHSKNTFKLRWFDKIFITPKCWFWLGAKSTAGYGSFLLRGKWHLTHRFMYEQKYGDIPKGLCACHKCDTPWCVNPDHIFIGTIGDNNRDRFLKRGKKLNFKIAKIIRDTENPGYIELAKKYHVHKDSIRNVLKNITWKN